MLQGPKINSSDAVWTRCAFGSRDQFCACFASIYRKKLSFSPTWGPSIKDVRIFLAVFDTPLPHVGILTLINLTSTF